MVEAARAIGDGELATRVERMPRWGEFAVLGDAINDMATRLQRQITDQKQLLAAVSHELRTPLGHMRILIDSGRERGEDPTMCDELEREVLRLDALVARLLTSSRLDFATLERRRVDVGQLVREALRAAGVGDEARVVIADPCEAEVDPTLVRSAVANLIDNAQRHGGGVREVRVDPDADYLATAGTVEIISVDPTFEVRLHDLEFTRVDIDDSTYQSTPTADGCASVLPEATVTTASDPFPGLALRGAARRR